MAGAQVRARGGLPREHGWRRGCQYPIGLSLVLAPVAGLSPEEVEAIRRNITARQETQEGAGEASSVL